MSELSPFILMIAVAGGIAFLFGGLLTLFRREDVNNRDQQPVRPMFGNATQLLAGMFPGSAYGREKMRQTLIRAGYFEPVALVNFLALRSFLMYPPMLLGVFCGFAFEGSLGVVLLGLGIVLGMLGYALPQIILSFQADSRTEQIRRGLPMLMDTLGLTLSTGASLSKAMLAAGESVRRGFPELTREIRVVVAQAPLYSMSYALDQWRVRQPIPELGSLVFLLSQGDRLGTDITKGLWELSSSMQVTARQRAEATANRSNFYMLFPTVLCLMLAAGLALVGPGIVQVIDQYRETNREMDERLEQQEKLRGEQPKVRIAPPPPPPRQPL